MDRMDGIREVLLIRQKHQCAICGAFLFQAEIDHKFPESLGGTDHPGNLQLLCGQCNRDKGVVPDGLYRTQLTRSLFGL